MILCATHLKVETRFCHVSYIVWILSVCMINLCNVHNCCHSSVFLWVMLSHSSDTLDHELDAMLARDVLNRQVNR